jgi:hypothetical protein
VTICNGCNRPHQTTVHLTPPDPNGVCHLEYLCTPCYQYGATYWDSIEPKGQAA